MKFLKSINKKLIVGLSFLLLVFSSCDNLLEEDVYSIYTPDNFYANDAQVLSSLSGAYRNFAGIPTFGQEYRALELCADQVACHGKIQGWWANSDLEQLSEHKWDASHGYLNTFWNTLFRTVGQANALISSLDASGLENVTGAKAELRVLRAYAYFYLMDLFGNVPIFTEPKVDPNNLPTQNTRAEVFDFVISELDEAVGDLPSQNDVGSEYYGRLTQEAVYSLRAMVYLNAEVYTGTAHWDDVITNADLVINSGAFSLLDDYFDNFVYNNEENAEMIWAGVYTPDVTGGPGHPIVQKVLPGIGGGLFGLPYTPQDGFGTRPSVPALYEDGDDRLGIFMMPGELKDPRNGETVMVEEIVPDGNSFLYVEGESTKGPVPYVIINATGIRNQPMNAGIKWIKWGLDPNTNGGNAGNDIAWFRLADVILMKAEALARKGSFDLALPLVNQIRARSHASTLSSVTLNDVFEERGRELVFEMKRRNDLIRFGKFNDAWEFKDAATDSHWDLFPIPQAAINANPNLIQNDGY